MDYGQLYDFCLDWMMCYVPKEDLAQQFRDNEWDFETFHRRAKEMGWWVTSMEILNETATIKA